MRSDGKILSSFSGGRTSAVMTDYLVRNYDDVEIVFANTGRERPETLNFVKRCADYFGWNITWIEAIVYPESGNGVGAKVVSYETADREGKVFEAVIAKHGIPSTATPHCSREMKAYAIRAHMRERGLSVKDYRTAIGFRIDEPKRLNWEKAKKENLFYPLATEYRKTRNEVNEWWAKMPFDLELKSYEGNCDLCWKKSKRKLKTLVLENPQLSDWWREMEERYEMYTPESKIHNPKIKPPHRFFRGNETIDEIIEESKLPFDLAVDESKEVDMFKQMALWDYEEDNAECSESCEAF